MAALRFSYVGAACVASLVACGGASETSLLFGDAGGAADAIARGDGARDVGSGGPGRDGGPTIEAGGGEEGSTCGASCVPEAPPGWLGPEELSLGSSGAPPCGSEFESPPAYDGHGDVVASAAECSTCTCGDPSGVACGSNVTLRFYRDDTCSKACGKASLTVDESTCTSATGVAAACGASITNMHVAIDAPAVSSGSCPPSMQTATLPPVSWGETGRSCAPAKSAKCSGGGVCVPDRDPGYGAFCIRRTGDQECVAPGYANKHLLFGAFHDGRSCTDCACGDVSGAACQDSTVTAYETNCTVFSSSKYTPLPVACAPFPVTTQFVTYSPTASGGSCAPHGGAPRGRVTPTEPTTFCCDR